MIVLILKQMLNSNMENANIQIKINRHGYRTQHTLVVPAYDDM